ncbi:MAG: hypothetical protein ACXQTQ_00030 [Candidatus Hecatellaceae archaeon]
MTRICRKIVRSKYYSKSNYEYVTLWLYIPKKHHEKFKEYIGENLKMMVHKADGKIQITLTPTKG